jgi:hypothetical protein
MEKVDFKKKYRSLYQPSADIVKLIDVPAMRFITIDGHGNPENSKDFQDGLEALYALAYAVKMVFKKIDPPPGYYDYTVPPLEGLWWVVDMEKFTRARKSDWRWKLMIRQPDFVTEHLIYELIAEIIPKKDNPSLQQIKYEIFDEGLSAQIMHVGPYVEEIRTITKINEFNQAHGYVINGKHHEIYLGDPRRAEPDKLKTVIRYPVKKQPH